MISKINIWRIFKDHFSTLKDNETDKASLIDCLFFFGLPIILVFILLWKGYLVNKDGLSLIFSTYSIFIGLLFNLLALLYSIFQNPKNQFESKKDLIKEMLANISFEIVLSIFSMIMAVISLVECWNLNYVFAGLTYYSTGICILTLFMVLKRIYLFIFDDISN